MTNLAILNPSQPQADYLGPAVLQQQDGPPWRLQLPNGQHVHAELALAFHYTPVAGDTLLTIGREEQYYVIGVLQGQGAVQLRVAGDIDIHSETGNIRLHAAKQIELAAPEVEVCTKRLRTLADAVVQRVTSVYQSVRETLTIHAGTMNTVVEGSAHTQAQSASLMAHDNVRVNGKAIHLG